MKWQSLQLKLTALVVGVVITVVASTAVLININVAGVLPTATQGIFESYVGYVGESEFVYGETAEVPIAEFELTPDEADIMVASTLQTIQMSSILFVIVVIIVAVGVSYWLIGRFLRSFQQLHTQLRTRDQQSLLAPLDVVSPHLEVQEMTEGVNHLLAKISHLFGEQQRLNASLAHELKTPLAVMQAKIDVLRLSTDVTAAEYEGVLQEVETKIKQMNQSIEALLDLSAGEQAELDEHVDYQQIVEAVIEDYQLFATEKGLVLTGDCQTLTPRRGNEILLYRCLANLCENALKYTPSGGQVVINGREGESQLEIQIQDTGIGMDEQTQARMFEPFYRSQKTPDGLGLGLALVANVVRLHGGEIQVTSFLGAGTTITLRFPLTQR